MPFKKNDKRINRSGRPKGSTNRSTEMMKVNVARAVNMGLDFLKEDYQRLREEDPKGALQLLTKLMEFTLPKLKSVETKGEVEHKIEQVVVKIQKDDNKTQE